MAAAFVLVQACSNQAPKQFVARVDQALLTEDELVASHDTLGGEAKHRRDYINEWVKDELLYQEAKRRGFADNTQVQRQIEATTKKLVIGALLEQELYGEESVSEDEIVALYAGGGKAFLLREDVVNASYALFGDRDAANAFRGNLVRDTSWNTAVEETQRDSSLKTQLLQIATRQYFTQSNLYPTGLWKLARNLGTGVVSFVVKTDAGFYVLMAHGVKKQGETPELDYIHNELRDRILIERRRMKYEKLLLELHVKHTVEVHLNEQDSTAHVNE